MASGHDAMIDELARIGAAEMAVEAHACPNLGVLERDHALCHVAGVGRADGWVSDATSLGTSPGGTPLTIVTLFGDLPRALAVSANGQTVYAAVLYSGNRTTAVSEGVVCNGGSGAGSCRFRLRSPVQCRQPWLAARSGAAELEPHP